MTAALVAAAFRPASSAESDELLLQLFVGGAAPHSHLAHEALRLRLAASAALAAETFLSLGTLSADGNSCFCL